MSNLSKYGSFDIEAAEADLAAATKQSADFFKFKNGQNVLRFLPPVAGQKSPFAVIYQHWINTPEGNRAPLNCARQMNKTACPVCEKMDEMTRSGNDADYRAANEYKAKLQILANVIDRDDETKGIQIARFGKSILDQLVAIRKDQRSGGDFTDPEDGFDLVITKKGEGMKTEYSVLPSRDFTPLSDSAEQIELWLNNQYDLDKFRYVPDYDEAYAKMTGEAHDAAAGRLPGRVTASGARKPEVLPPAATTRPVKRRGIEDDVDDIKY